MEAKTWEKMVDMVDYIHSNYEELYCKKDGSLNENGFEIVSHPLTYWYLTKVLKIRKILRKLRKDGCTSWKNKRCGLHVHVSLDYFEYERQAVKLACLINKLMETKHFRYVIGRTNHQVTNWCQLHNHNELVKGLKLNKISYHLKENRYKCVNFQNRNTLEIRIFRGSLKAERVLAYFQLLEILLILCKNVGISFCVKAPPNKIFELVLDYAKKYNFKELLSYIDKV